MNTQKVQQNMVKYDNGKNDNCIEKKTGLQ